MGGGSSQQQLWLPSPDTLQVVNQGPPRGACAGWTKARLRPQLRRIGQKFTEANLFVFCMHLSLSFFSFFLTFLNTTCVPNTNLFFPSAHNEVNILNSKSVHLFSSRFGKSCVTEGFYSPFLRRLLSKIPFYHSFPLNMPFLNIFASIFCMQKSS